MVDRIIGGPRPSTELGTVVVSERLINLGLGVHHEWSVLRYWLTNGLSLEHENFHRRIASPE